MATKYYITAPEAAKVMGISDGKAYEIFRELNRQLKAEGYIVVAGRVPLKLFNERFFGGIDMSEVGA